jgi:hypothetical protein
MSITTSQQISKWYELYKTIDITFTKEIIKTTGLDARGVFLKCLGEQWPCVLYSSSFSSAKVVASSRASLMDKIKKANNLVSLRYSFKLADKTDPLSFFIAAKATGFSPYTAGGSDLQIANLVYTQQPPDDFIEIMGRLLDANINSARRRSERIILTPDSMRKIGLVSKDSVIFVQGVPRKCILRDLSFSGAKAIILGVAKFLMEKQCSLRIDMEEPNETVELIGKIVRFENVEGRKDLTAVAIEFDESLVPMGYKLHINAFLSQVRQHRGEPDPAQNAAGNGSDPAKRGPGGA